MFINHTFFVGKLSVPSLDTPPIMENLDLCIKEREPEVMHDMIGVVKYDELIAKKEAGTLTPDEEIQVEYLSKICVRFVWYWYSRENNSLFMAGGQAQANNENATNISPAQKQSEIWNEMSDLMKRARHHHKCLAQIELFCWGHERGKYQRINVLNF